MSLRYLHTMVRVTDIKQSLDFYCTKLGMEEVRRVESEAGRYTLVFLAAPQDKGRAAAERAPPGCGSASVGVCVCCRFPRQMHAP